MCVQEEMNMDLSKQSLSHSLSLSVDPLGIKILDNLCFRRTGTHIYTILIATENVIKERTKDHYIF